MRAPIALFAYRRPEHLRKTLAALAKNDFADTSDLIIFCDAAKTLDAEQDVSAVRLLAAKASGFRTVTVVKRPQNLGLARSIISGVAEIVAERGRVIVVEDDLMTSRHFLRYMNDGLDAYATDERVASIHGYVYPVRNRLPETFFLRGADCWGWATWRRAWSVFEEDGRKLITELRERGLTERFDFDGSYQFTQMLADQVDGRNDSWAVRWHASTFLREMLTLYPGRSLVHNIGNDDSGTNCVASDVFDSSLSESPVVVGDTPVEESVVARTAFIDYLSDVAGKGRPWLGIRLWRRLTGR